ncbi:MAG: hypothetical protein ABEJ03_04990 [Candidatus Nanohaloarchaea archaeon]
MIRRMLKEEYRMHSDLYRGRSFATFPLVVASMSLLFSWFVLEYSTLRASSLGTSLQVLGGFLGLAVGSVGFSSRDAMKNVLGPVNFLVYSSRTLPLSERRLLSEFVLKDILYYTVLFLLPAAAGPLILAPGAASTGALMMAALFLSGMAVSLVATRASVRLPSARLLEYGRMPLEGELSRKSILDVSRSSGGLLKILFSLGILTGFYWFSVLYFPPAASLLNNPLLSFSAAVGLLNLSVYNWLNRFDSLEKYSYLPVDRDTLLRSKKKAHLAVSIPLSALLVVGGHIFHSGNLVLSLLSAFSTTAFVLFVASELTGLSPNRRLFESGVFLKFLGSTSAVTVPLLLFSLVYSGSLFLEYFLVVSLLLSGSLYACFRS